MRRGGLVKLDDLPWLRASASVAIAAAAPRTRNRHVASLFGSYVYPAVAAEHVQEVVASEGKLYRVAPVMLDVKPFIAGKRVTDVFRPWFASMCGRGHQAE
jgi:hypothetical protein